MYHKLLHSQTSSLVPWYKTLSNSKWHKRFFYLDLRSMSQVKVKGHRHGDVCVLWMLLGFFFHLFFFFTPPRNRGGFMFSLQIVSVCVCLSVCLSVRLCLWTKFQPNRWTDLDAIFAKWLLIAQAQTLLKLVTLSQRSRSQWCNIHFIFIFLC